MKETPNRQFSETDTTVSFLTTSLNFTERGFDLVTMRSRSRVLDAIEKVETGGIIKLEDADYAVAQDAIRNVKWTKVSKDLIAFAEQFGL